MRGIDPARAGANAVSVPKEDHVSMVVTYMSNPGKVLRVASN